MLESLTVPANPSRYFNNRVEAMGQPSGVVTIEWNVVDGYFHNTSFDEKLIFHDENYCTTDSFHIQNSLQVFLDLQKKHSVNDVTDIGCGQGEFVKSLAILGFNAIGYDPVLKKQEESLKREYFNPIIHTKPNKREVYVLRCVLPHIANPWDFVDCISSVNPLALFYVEFQRLEWILENKVWPQISHDHVNLFSILDFQRRYRILESGSYSAGEWGYALFEQSTINNTEFSRAAVIPPANGDMHSSSNQQSVIKDLFDVRRRQIEELANMNGPLLVYGGAGKGIVFSYAMLEAGRKDVFVVDADINRQGKFLECSGVKVYSPSLIIREVESDALVVVMNKNHLSYARQALIGFRNVVSL
jgi:hypothetical protein